MTLLQPGSFSEGWELRADMSDVKEMLMDLAREAVCHGIVTDSSPTEDEDFRWGGYIIRQFDRNVP